MRRRQRGRREPTIALINIVFLMLVFFMVAGTLTPPMDGEVSLVRTAEIEGRAPPDALVVYADGRLTWRGEEIDSPRTFLERSAPGASEPDVRVVPDRDLPASRLIGIAGALRAAGAARVLIVTERGLP